MCLSVVLCHLSREAPPAAVCRLIWPPQLCYLFWLLQFCIKKEDHLKCIPLYIWMPVCFCIFSNSFIFLYFSNESLYYSTEGNKRVNFSLLTDVLFYISSFTFHFGVPRFQGLGLFCVCVSQLLCIKLTFTFPVKQLAFRSLWEAIVKRDNNKFKQLWSIDVALITLCFKSHTDWAMKDQY